MKPNRMYAETLKKQEKYERDILAIKLTDDLPEDAEPYGDNVSFLCAMVAEVWAEKKTLVLTNKNVVCGGGVYAGIGTKKLTEEDFSSGMTAVIGKNMAYCSREVLRRVNQQIPHFFKHRKYLVMGLLETLEAPDMVMIVADADRIMRLCKAYTWKTGELVQGIQGTAWCAETFPYVYRHRTMTYNLGDPPSRMLMGLGPDEMYCAIHYNLLPLIIDNLQNISTGDFA